MNKKIIKQNLRFYSKFLLLIGALIAFLCSFGVSSYAWHTDSIGNLVSDNILKIEDQTNTSLGVSFVCRNNKITLNGTATTTGPVWFNINIPSGTYTLQDYNNFTYNDGFRISLRSGYGSLRGSLFYNTINDTATFTSATDMNILAVSVVQGVTYNNVILTPTLVVGTTPLTSYEAYGATYYPYSRVQREAYINYGVYQFIDNIKIEYNTGSSIGTYNTYTTPIIPNPLTSPLSFSNGTLILSYDILNDILGGSNNWYYVLTITFKNNRVKISDFNQWNVSTIGNNLTFLSYSNTTYTKSNATGISYSVNLTDNGFNSSEYLKSITLNITGFANNNMFTQIGSPNDSLSYMYGYNYGYEKGKDAGFDSGFTDGKNEGYTMGYNDGYRDGTNEEFTTNGFKTLIGSIFNYPINMIRSVFNFEFMGINIFSMIVFIMSIGIVIFVIRRFKK